MTAATRPELSVSEPNGIRGLRVECEAMEVGDDVRGRRRARLRTLPSGDLAAVARAIAQARRRFVLPPSAPAVSCYEAGRDGFWIHRALTVQGIRRTGWWIRPVSKSSRRARRAKTDRLDALKLVAMLVGVCHGECGVWREVRAPQWPREAAGTSAGSAPR